MRFCKLLCIVMSLVTIDAYAMENDSPQKSAKNRTPSSPAVKAKRRREPVTPLRRITGSIGGGQRCKRWRHGFKAQEANRKILLEIPRVRAGEEKTAQMLQDLENTRYLMRWGKDDVTLFSAGLIPLVSQFLLPNSAKRRGLSDMEDPCMPPLDAFGSSAHAGGAISDSDDEGENRNSEQLFVPIVPQDGNNIDNNIQENSGDEVAVAEPFVLPLRRRTVRPGQ